MNENEKAPIKNKVPVKPNIVKPNGNKTVNKNPLVNATNKPKVKENNSKKVDNSTIKPKVKEIDAKNVNVASSNKEATKKKAKKIITISVIIAIIIIIILLMVTCIKAPKPSNINFEIILDSEIQTNITDPDTGEVLETIKYMPGDKINGTFNIEIKNLNGVPVEYEKVYLRFRIDIEVEDNFYSGLFDPSYGFNKKSDWTIGSDDYYYYNKSCFGDENIDVFTFLDFIPEKNNNVLNGKTGKLILVVEIIEGKPSAINQIWHTAPTSWRTSVR